MSDRMQARKDQRARRKANRLASMPKGRMKRMAYRLRPQYLASYWFSREGAIMALKVVGIGIVASFVILIGLFAYFRKDMPILNNISGQNLGGSINYYDRTGKVLLWQDYNAVKRISVSSKDISKYMKEATVAIEDKNFYHEGGFSVSGIIRAGIHDLTGAGGLQGASTITEQLVKLNENWIGQRTIADKIKEVILSVDVNREYTKDQILTGYLNIAPYGGVDYGVQAAAEDYFGENASQLTLAQSAMLAAIPQSPGYYSPFESPKYNPALTANYFGKQALIARKNYVLEQMAVQGYITKAQAKAAEQVHVLSQVHMLTDKYANIKAPYFVLAAKQELMKKYGAATVARGGWNVTTTLNMQLQQYAQQDIQNNLPNVQQAKGNEEAVIEEDVKTGQIVADVGGVNFNNPQYGQINWTQAKLPPGSSFKPYDYVSMINDTTNTGAGSVLYDVEQPLPGYPCTNKALPQQGGNCLMDYDFKFPGAETVRYALAGSRNVPAVKAMLTVGTNKVISTADALMNAPNGYQCYANSALTIPAQCYAASAIGYGAYLHLDNHVNGDASLARLGVAIPRTYILKITNSAGKVIYQWTQPKGVQVVRPDAAYIIDNILSDPRATYLPGYCTATNCTPLSSFGYKFQRYNGWDIAIKTGTTHNNYDGLMTAWTTQFAVVSWVGSNTGNVAMNGVMEYLTEPLTRTLMEQSLSSLHMAPVNWKQPPGIQVLPAYIQRKHIDFGDEEPGPSKDLFPSWYKSPKGSGTQTIDKVSGDLATSCTPPLAKEVLTNNNANLYSADIFWPPNQKPGSGNITATDTVHNCNDTPPSVTLTVTDSSTGQANQCNGSCTVTATVTQGTHPLSDPKYPQFPGTVNISVNGKQVKSFTNIQNSPTTVSFTYTPTTTGSETFSAEVIDSVLYTGTSSTTVTTNVPTTSSPSSPTNQTTSGGNGGTGGTGGTAPPTN